MNEYLDELHAEGKKFFPKLLFLKKGDEIRAFLNYSKNRGSFSIGSFEKLLAGEKISLIAKWLAKKGYKITYSNTTNSFYFKFDDVDVRVSDHGKKSFDGINILVRWNTNSSDIASQLRSKGIIQEQLTTALRSKSKKGNRYFKMLKTGLFQHYDMPKGELSKIGDDEDRKRLVSKLSREDKTIYKKWLKTPEGQESLKNFTSLNENVNHDDIGLIRTEDYLVLLDMKTKNIIGIVGYDEVDADLYHVPVIAAERGYGYLLYAIVMSLVKPSYIITDRDSSTSYAATVVLKKMYNDANIEHVTLDVNDKNYVKFYKNTEEEQIVKNTKFRIKNPVDVAKLKHNGDKLKDSIDLDDLNEKAFQFFSRKLNG